MSQLCLFFMLPAFEHYLGFDFGIDIHLAFMRTKSMEDMGDREGCYRAVEPMPVDDDYISQSSLKEQNL